MEQMKIDEQKKASQSGYDPDILPPAIKMYIEDIEKLLGDLNSKNERLFHISISLRAYAKSKKELKLLSEMLKRTCQKNNCIMFPYDYRQEQTLVSTLPLDITRFPSAVKCTLWALRFSCRLPQRSFSGRTGYPLRRYQYAFGQHD
ncbi:MAG: hypothetical protein ACLST1_06095 [[Eubacterium] siraeum]